MWIIVSSRFNITTSVSTRIRCIRVYEVGWLEIPYAFCHPLYLRSFYCASGVLGFDWVLPVVFIMALSRSRNLYCLALYATCTGHSDNISLINVRVSPAAVQQCRRRLVVRVRPSESDPFVGKNRTALRSRVVRFPGGGHTTPATLDDSRVTPPTDDSIATTSRPVAAPPPDGSSRRRAADSKATVCTTLFINRFDLVRVVVLRERRRRKIDERVHPSRAHTARQSMWTVRKISRASPQGSGRVFF